jgi:dolichol-phosphate mannosyltransferase
MLPTLNEEEALESVIARIPVSALKKMNWKPRIVVVDGGSEDSTIEIANNLGCESIVQWGKGKGAGMRQAFEHFLTTDDQALVMLDADGTYSPEEMIDLLINLSNENVVIGDRLHGKMGVDAMTPLNWAGNHMLTWLAVALHGKTVNDLCSGYWAFSRFAIENLKLNSMRFEIEAEMYTSCALQGITISHVPISYSKRIGEAKLGSIKDGGSIARKLIIRRIFPIPHEAIE